jgi:urease accessory protein
MQTMRPTAPLCRDIQAGNRAVGRIALAVAAALGITRRTRLHEAGSLRLRFPRCEGQAWREAVIVNTAGGMAGGDNFEIGIDVGTGAKLRVTTAAAEKIYRSLASDTEIHMKLEIAKHGALTWLPQETIVFNGVRLRRSVDVHLAPGANLLFAESVVFGRSAMGEIVREGKFMDRWRVKIENDLVFADNIRLDGAISHTLSKAAVAKDGIGIATVLKIPGGDDDVAAVRAMATSFSGEVGASAWNGLAFIRCVAPSGVALRRDLIATLTALRAAPLPRLWPN